MNRRSFCGGLLAATALGGGFGRSAAPAFAAQGSTAPAVDVVDRFGFVPDGRTDNYDAFHRFTRHVSQAGGGNYVFRPGTYFVGRHRGPSNGGQNARIVGAEGLTITGTGAKIVLNGRFRRSQGRGFDNAMLMVFDLWDCRNVRIAGFDIDGGVRDTSRDPSVMEIYSHLIALNGCVGVTLEDLDLHHSQTDAVYLYQSGHSPGRRIGRACRDITLRRVTCRNNARGGLAALNVSGLLCVDCSFSGNATGLGRYTWHPPGFGVAMEPDQFGPDNIDVWTGNLEFRNCRFDDNITAFGAAYSSRYRGYLRLIDCSSTNPGNHLYHIFISWPGAVIERGRFDVGTGAFYTSWQGETGSDVTIRDTEIRTSGLHGLFHYHAGNIVNLERVKIVGTHTGPGTHGVVLDVSADPGRGRRNRMTGCDIFIPAARKSRAHPYDIEVNIRHTVSQDNVFRTNLAAGAGHYFCTDYGERAVAIRDRYRGTAPGPNDSFRPALGSSHDTRQPFST